MGPGAKIAKNLNRGFLGAGYIMNGYDQHGKDEKNGQEGNDRDGCRCRGDPQVSGRRKDRVLGLSAGGWWQVLRDILGEWSGVGDGRPVLGSRDSASVLLPGMGGWIIPHPSGKFLQRSKETDGNISIKPLLLFIFVI